MVEEPGVPCYATWSTFVSEGTRIHFPQRLRLGRPCGNVGDSVRVNHIGARSCNRNSTSEQCGPKCNQKNSNQRHPSVVPPESWEQLDEVDVVLGKNSHDKELSTFSSRDVLRQCWAVALRERHRARQVHDNAAEERAWKLFGLVPVMLLHRPRGSGSVGRDELAQRADDFARGHWIALLHNARLSVVEGRGRIAKSKAQEQARRGRAALSRVQQGQVSRARQELTGADLAQRHWTRWRNCRAGDPKSEAWTFPRT